MFMQPAHHYDGVSDEICHIQYVHFRLLPVASDIHMLFYVTFYVEAETQINNETFGFWLHVFYQD